MSRSVLRNLGRAISVLAVCGCALPAMAQGIHSDSAPYHSIADSPFTGIGLETGYFYLENFEDGLLNTPGASAVGGIALLRNDLYGDSVDADDGVIDNNGNSDGKTTGAFYSNGLFALEFHFDATALGGGLPTHVGVVMTDCINNTAMTFAAYRQGSLLGSVSGTQIAERVHVTAMDRFYGFVDAGGIDKVVFTAASDSDWAMDHLQYGRGCRADFNADTFLDFSDFDAFVGAFEAGEAKSDFNGDGFLDFSDFDAFVVAFEKGC